MITNTLYHTPNTFCQGLIKYNNYLFESSGLFNKSFIQKYDLSNEKIIAKYYFKPDIFAEGLTVLNNKLYCSSWKNPLIFEFDLDLKLLSSKQLSEIEKVWGLTTDQNNFIITDGTNNIYIVDPNNLFIKQTIETQQTKLNAITYSNDTVYSNIWEINQIIQISLSDGNILKRWDLSNIFIPKPYISTYLDNAFIIDDYSYDEYVLNGITNYNDDSFLITGKYWNRIYMIKLN